MQRKVLEQINILNEKIRYILATHDLSARVCIQSDDEIGELAEEFNQLIDEIEDLYEVLEQKNEALFKEAHYDTLTSLPNRALFHDRLHQTLARAKRNKEQFAILFFDLNDFKKINDTLGHDIGDILLQTFAKRISKIIREQDTLARMGGDEFLLLLENTNKEGVKKVIEKIFNALKDPLVINEESITIKTSIGVALYPEDGEDASTLIKHADIAMYEAKKSDKKLKFTFYDQKMEEELLKESSIEKSLQKAMQKDELYLLYQPQIFQDRVVGVEALVRWKKDNRTIPPFEFLPIATKSGQIVDIDRYVIDRALKEFNKHFCQQIQLSINLSPKTLLDRGFLSFVRSKLLAYSVDPARITFEILEDDIIQNLQEAIKILKELKKLGIKIATDDFGTGHSSLAYLRDLPIDELKIDRIFIKHAIQNKKDRALVRTFCDLAENMNMDIVAEGVESPEQASYLKQIGNVKIQGYLYAKPLSIDEFKNFLKDYPCDGDT